MRRLLVVEDDKTIARNLQRGLSKVGYDVVTAETAEEGMQYALNDSFDGMVLDIMLPDRSGLDLLRDLRSAGFAAAVVILSARSTVDDRVRGLDAGADDYLVKPFAFKELQARLRAQLDRTLPGRQAILSIDDLELYPASGKVFRGGTEIELTTLEFQLLEYLLRHKNCDVSRNVIARDVWKKPKGSGTNVIDVYVKSLRNKLERAGSKPLIHTIRGVGYSLRAEDDATANRRRSSTSAT